MVREVIAMVKTFYVNPETGEILSEDRIADIISEILGTEDWMIVQKENVTEEVVVKKTTSNLVFVPGELSTEVSEEPATAAGSEAPPAEGEEGKIGDNLMKIVSLAGVKNILNKKITIR